MVGSGVSVSGVGMTVGIGVGEKQDVRIECAFVWECGVVFFFQAEDGIRDLVRSRGLGVCIRDRPKKAVIADWIVSWRRRRALAIFTA